MELVYFPLLARNVLTLLLARRRRPRRRAAIAVDWPAYKAETMFGQLPQLEGEGVPGGKLGQSMAIARFLARKAKRDGATDAEFARSEMLLEKMTEIYDCDEGGERARREGVPASEVGRVEGDASRRTSNTSTDCWTRTRRRWVISRRSRRW